MRETTHKIKIDFRTLLEVPLVPLARTGAIKMWIPIVVCNMDETFVLATSEFGDPLNWLVTRIAVGRPATSALSFASYMTVTSLKFEQLYDVFTFVGIMPAYSRWKDCCPWCTSQQTSCSSSRAL